MLCRTGPVIPGPRFFLPFGTVDRLMTGDQVAIPQTDSMTGPAVPPRRPRRRRWPAIAAATVVILGAGGFGFAMMLNHLGATVQRYLRTVGSGDFAKACDTLTDSGKTKLMAQQQTTTCEAAVAHWRASLRPDQVNWLVHGRIWVNGYAAEDSRKEIKLFGNPLGIGEWVIYKHGGREWISDWGPGSAKIPPATD